MSVEAGVVIGEGELFDCDALASTSDGGISGSGLATAFPAIDSNQIGDNVTSTVLNHR